MIFDNTGRTGGVAIGFHRISGRNDFKPRALPQHVVYQGFPATF